MASRYNSTVTEHFAHPRNLGRLPSANGRGIVGELGRTPVQIEIAIRVEGDVIAEVRFRAFGCAAVIAASSIVTDLVSRRPRDFAKHLTPEAVTLALGGLPDDRQYAPRLAVQALHAAIANFEDSLPPTV